MSTDQESKLARAHARANRLKTARDEAERLLEQKSRELYAANRELEAIQRGLEDDIQLATHELSVSNQRLQKSLEERSTFIGQMSHELRTPLNAVVGLSEILLTTELKANQLDYVDTMNSAARGLIILLNDMLDITKIEAGKLTLHPEPVDIRRVHQHVVSLFRSQAKTKGLTLELKMDDDLPACIRLDKGRYKQILSNLISNSLKNTEHGLVKVYVSYQINAVANGVGMLNVEVIDTGVGVPKSKQKSIFRAYEQLGSSNQGVGLGLAICNQLCELMQGDIVCHSILGEGSVFEFNIPAEEVPGGCDALKPELEVLPKRSENLAILVAEDNPTNQKVLAAQLAQLGQKAEIVDNGAQALAKLENESYDLVLMDILMPILDGEQALLQIRGSEKRIADHYCVALTASNFQDQKERLLALGFDDFLSKPLSLSDLAAALASVPTRATDHQLLPDDETSPLGQKWTTPPSKPEQSIAPFDASYFEQQFGAIWETIFAEVAPVFLDHCSEELARLKESISSADAEQVKKISHSIKGGAASMGQVELSNLLADIEEEPNAPRVHSLIESVEQTWAQIRMQLRQELRRIASDL